MYRSVVESDPVLGRRLITSFVVAECLLLAGNLGVRVCQKFADLPSWLVGAIAVASTVPMMIFAIKFFGMLRTDLDEMIQRIVLEGLALAMVVFVPLAGLYVNARAAGLIRATVDPPELFLIPSILVAVGVLVSWSRHK